VVEKGERRYTHYHQAKSRTFASRSDGEKPTWLWGWERRKGCPCQNASALDATWRGPAIFFFLHRFKMAPPLRGASWRPGTRSQVTARKVVVQASPCRAKSPHASCLTAPLCELAAERGEVLRPGFVPCSAEEFHEARPSSCAFRACVFGASARPIQAPDSDFVTRSAVWSRLALLLPRQEKLLQIWQVARPDFNHLASTTLGSSDYPFETG